MVFKELLFPNMLKDITSLVDSFIGKEFLIDGKEFVFMGMSGNFPNIKLLFERKGKGYKTVLSPIEIYEQVLQGGFTPKDGRDKKLLISKILEYPNLSPKDRKKLQRWL